MSVKRMRQTIMTMKINSRFVRCVASFFTCWAMLLCLVPQAFAQSPQVVKVDAALDGNPDSGTSAVVVRLTIDPSYHINANPASASYLIPVAVTMAPAKGVTFGQPVYPAGKKTKFAFESKPLAVYENAVSIRVPITAGASTAASATLNGSVRYQACNDQACLFPTTARFSVQNASGGNAAVEPATEEEAASTSGGESANAYAENLRRKYGVVGLPAIVFLDGKGNERTDLRAGEELTRPVMVEKLAALETGQPWKSSTRNEAGAASWMERLKRAPLLLQLALVFVGGLLLNLTPCVYPMIPITVGYFGGQSEGRIGKTLGLALLYVLGLALVYSALGVFAALTGSLFGSLLQSRFVVGAVAIVLFLLALSMLGAFTIQPPRFLMARSGAKKGAAGALAMGALLGIVAAPCVGPVVAALLLYVGEQRSPQLGFVLFFSLSLGLGLPYLLLGAFSGAIKSLPKSGMWLERSKKIFAVPLLLAALYYGYSAVRPAPGQVATDATTTISATAQASEPATAATTGRVMTSAGSGKEWKNATAAVLDEARRSGRPVVLDFRADWCIPCLKLEREVFSRPEVLNAASGTTLLKVDLSFAGS
ncbi:MAG TPA: cytochrome c biogenesis protein CcdA [Abditibacteriaceae bacterium]|jgi:thiol:disulfide interchange protein DsbD